MGDTFAGDCTRRSSFVVSVRVEGDGGQHVQGSAHVEELRVHVGVSGELRVRVAHCCLPGPERDGPTRKMGGKSVAQRVHVHSAAPLVPLFDPREGEITVEDLDECLGHVEEGPGRIQSERKRHTLIFRGSPFLGEAVLWPVSQVGCEVLSELDLRSAPRLFVGRLQYEVGAITVEEGLSDPDACEFTPAKSREDQCPVDERALATEARGSGEIAPM